MDYDVGVRLDAIIARQDAAKQERAELKKMLSALIEALSEAEAPEKPEEVGPTRPKLSKKAPGGGQWQEA